MWLKISAELTHFLRNLTKCGFCKIRFLGGISIILKNPPLNIWSVSVPLRKIEGNLAMPHKIGKRTKTQLIAWFRFIEGISINLELQQVKLLQIEGRFARTPPWTIEVKFKVFHCSKQQNSTNSSEVSEIVLRHKILDLNHSNFWPLNKANSKIPEQLQFRLWILKGPVTFRCFAFEKWNLLMQKFKNSKNSEISGFGNNI